MIRPASSSSLSLAVLVLSLGAWASEAVGASEGKRANAQNATVAAPLRRSITTSTTDAIAGPDGFVAWVDPARCDADGNLFFLNARSRPTRKIVGVSVDGKRTTRFDPGRASDFGGTGELTTVTTAIDSNGTLFALVWVPGGPASGGQYIVSFEKSGRYASDVEIDAGEISVVQQFEVFGTGEFLVRGLRCQPPSEVVIGERCVSRLVVLSSDGASHRDVRGVLDRDDLELSKTPGPTLSPKVDYMARGGDGRIYAARKATSSIYAIDASGQSQDAFPLARTPSHLHLAGLRASGRRLVATYRDETSRQLRSWLAVYDVTLGRRVNLYGPVEGTPLCYENTGSEDRFTFLRNGNRLETLAP